MELSKERNEEYYTGVITHEQVQHIADYLGFDLDPVKKIEIEPAIGVGPVVRLTQIAVN